MLTQRSFPFTTIRLLMFFSLVAIGSSSATMAQQKSADLRWKKHSINDQSPYEACGAADFNGDGKIDIFCGDSWYEAPNWTRHKVRDVPASGPNPHYYEDFSDSPLDVNGDGRADIVTCNYFGKRVAWVENPGGDATKPWVEHEIDTPGNMESGELVDINGDGKLDFLPNPGNVVVWYELTQQKPQVIWKKHDLGSEGAGHGVGVGDINRDGRLDIVTPKGWYEQPQADSSMKWPFHQEFELGAAGIMIHGRDIDGDRLTDIVWGMGHDFGLHWLKQSTGPDGKRIWTKHDIDGTFSQVHTLLFANLDQKSDPVLVTGKRVYAHEVEPGATDSSVIFYYRYDRTSEKWLKHTIFHGDPAVNAPKDAKDRWALKDFPPSTAGTGLQMSALDIDGDGDIDLVCPGKSGLYLLENLGESPAKAAHRFLCCDHNGGKVCVVSEKGEIEWEYPCKAPQDCWKLKNGNYLFCFSSGAVEVTSAKQVVWEYKAPEKTEVHACQPLSDGSVLVCECGTSRLIEVDRAGKISKEIKLTTTPDIHTHNQFRGARKTKEGHYLVCFKGEGKVVELNGDGKVLRAIKVPGDPHEVLALSDGHLLVTCGDAHKVIELDASEKVVWELNENDLPGNTLRLMAGCQRLKNGNTVFCNYLGHGHIGQQPQFFEVTRDKKVVWQFDDHKNFKTINQIFVLDESGDAVR